MPNIIPRLVLGSGVLLCVRMDRARAIRVLAGRRAATAAEPVEVRGRTKGTRIFPFAKLFKGSIAVPHHMRSTPGLATSMAASTMTRSTKRYGCIINLVTRASLHLSAPASRMPCHISKTITSVDLLHVDGRHYYEDVKQDFLQWAPKLAPNAIVLFHDVNVRERGFGVGRLFKELSEKHPTFEFYHDHGLGVAAVGAVPEALEPLFSAGLESSAQVRTVYAALGRSLSVRRADQLSKELSDQLAARTAELENLQAERAQMASDQLAARTAELENLQAERAQMASDQLAARTAELENLQAERAQMACDKLAARTAELENLQAERTQMAAGQRTERQDLRIRSVKMIAAQRSGHRELENKDHTIRAFHRELENKDRHTIRAFHRELENKDHTIRAIQQDAGGALHEAERENSEDFVRRLAGLTRCNVDGRIPSRLVGWRWLPPGRRKKQRQLIKGYRLIASAPLFDRGWYLQNNPDVGLH